MSHKRVGETPRLAALALPMALAQWTPVPISSFDLPKVTASERSWRLQTHSNAGGYAYLLDEPLSANSESIKLAWKWKVTRFSDTSPSPPFDKKQDDYALRIGVLLSDGSSGIRIPAPIAQSLSEHHRSLSYVLFYCANRSPDQRCGINPYDKHVVNCLRPAGNDLTAQTADPIEDALRELSLPTSERSSLKIIGLWLFADSDNSHSESDALLTDLELLHTRQTSTRP